MCILDRLGNHRRIAREQLRELSRYSELQSESDDPEHRAEAGGEPAGARRAIGAMRAEVLSNDRRRRRPEADADHEQPTFDAVADAERGERRRAETCRRSREHDVDDAERDAGERGWHPDLRHGTHGLELNAADAD